jgi:hypothetical protein
LSFIHRDSDQDRYWIGFSIEELDRFSTEELDWFFKRGTGLVFNEELDSLKGTALVFHGYEPG